MADNNEQENVQEFPRMVYHPTFIAKKVGDQESMDKALGEGWTKLPADHTDPADSKDNPDTSAQDDATAAQGFGFDHFDHVPSGEAGRFEKSPGWPDGGDGTSYPANIPTEATDAAVVAEGEAEVQAKRDSDGVFENKPNLIENPSTNDVEGQEQEKKEYQ